MANLKKTMCHSRFASTGLCHLMKYRNGNYHSRSRHGSYTHAKPVTEQEKRASLGQKSHVKEIGLNLAAYTLLSDYWLLYILGPPMYEPAQEKWFNSNHS